MKLYLIVREGMSPGDQASQLVHAMRQWSADHPEADLEWFTKSNTVALLAVPNEVRLNMLAEKARDRRIPVACFREPDLGYALTAITLGPQGKSLTRNLPKALRSNG